MSETRYAQIARNLAEGIGSSRFSTGSLLPSESMLCEIYGASRHTVRAALRELEDLGLISRHKGIGTRIERAQTTSGFNQSLASLEDLIQLAANHLRVVKKTGEIVADTELAQVIECAPGTRWFHIRSIRQNEAKTAPPICWTDNYVDIAYSGIKKLVSKHPYALISELIETEYGQASAEVFQSITAIGVPTEMAEELKAPVGSPALKIIRRYIGRSGKVFSTTVSIHPAGRFTFSMVLKRASIQAEA